MLLLSKYALACQAYHTTCERISWRECSLRGWLNYRFLNEAFSKEEQKRILTVTVPADKNPKYYHISSGADVEDKVFLLSIHEWNRYAALSDDIRKCAMTDGVILQHAHRNNNDFVDGRAAAYWWLRTPGLDADYAAFVYPFGAVCETGSPVNTFGYCVRPAMWVDFFPLNSES